MHETVARVGTFEPVIQQLQLTVFVPGPPVAVLSAIAAAFPGVSPSAFQNQGPQQNATIELGAFRVTVASQPDRIDFMISPPESQMPPLAPPAELDFPTARAMLVPAVAGFAALQDTNRLAVIINAATEAASVLATVELACAKIPGLTLPPGTSEIDYKINVPRSAGVEGVVLNRLHRWFSAARTVIQFVMGPTGPAANPLQDVQWALVQVIDINTALESQLKPSDSERLFLEMTNEAVALYEKGYEAFT